MKKDNTPRSPKEVMRQVVEELGMDFAKQIYLDRSWLWYCGPPLRDHPEKRTILKTLGFRFAPNGHPMKIGTKTVMSNWGHSCDKPITRFKKKEKPAQESAPPAPEEVDVDSVLASL